MNLYLEDVHTLVKSFGLVEDGHCYIGKMDAKKDKSIGIYNSKHAHAYKTAIGGPGMESYGTKYMTLLVHWNKSPSETEKSAMRLFDALVGAREVTVNNKTVKFIQPLYGVQDVGTDEAGIFEMAIEVAVVYGKGE